MPNKPLSQEEKRKGVRFVRIRGRVVPIKDKGQGGKPRKRTPEERAKYKKYAAGERKKAVTFAKGMGKYHRKQAKFHKKTGKGMTAVSAATGFLGIAALAMPQGKAALGLIGASAITGLSSIYHRVAAKKRSTSARRWSKEAKRLEKGGSSVTY